MKITGRKCADHFELTDDDSGKHHEALHNRIYELEKKLAERSQEPQKKVGSFTKEMAEPKGKPIAPPLDDEDRS